MINFEVGNGIFLVVYVAIKTNIMQDSTYHKNPDR